MADAQITVGANAKAVERAMGEALKAAKNLGAGLKESVGYGLSSVASSLSEVALASGKISFASQHQQVQAFEAATARLAIASGRDLGAVRSEAEATGIAIGKRPAEVLAWSDSVGRLTYNFKGAGESMRGMAGLAAQTGRSVEDYRGLAVTLGTVGHVAGDTTSAIGLMAAQAEKFKPPGGIAAFADQIEGLSDTISHFATEAPGSFAKVTAGMAALGAQSNSPAMASRVQQATFGSIASNPMEWSRYLGKDITDKYGHVEDPTKVLEQITNKIKKTYGKDSTRMLMMQFGPEAGKALARADFKGAAEASGLTPSTKPTQALKDYQATAPGQREVANAQLAVSSNNLLNSATLLGSAADALQKFAAKNPITSSVASTIASTVVSTALGGKVGGKIIGAGGEIAGGLVKTAGGGVGGLAKVAGGLGGAAALGYGVGTLLDESLGLSDMISGTGGSSRIKSESDKGDKAADAALAQRVAEIRKQNAAIHVHIHTAPETPVTATVKTSQSAAAGNQG